VKSRAWLALILAAAAAACHKKHKKPKPPPPPPPAFTEIRIDAPQGLSGLAADAAGALWSVAERHGVIAKITMDAPQPTVTRYPVTGIPTDTDLEGIEIFDGDRVAIAGESQHAAAASVMLASRTADGYHIDKSIDLPRDRIGVELTENHGAESVCGEGDTMVVGIEVVGIDAGRRYAPVVRMSGDHVIGVQRLWLTSDKGKLSALDCHVAADGTVTGWAIERHYATSRILRFTLPPLGTGGDAAEGILAFDLEPYLKGRLNLEGIAELPDGRVVAVNDNESDTISGPTELLVFPAGSLSGGPARTP